MAKFKIDPGHGGHDPGALGRYSKEKDNVLKVAKRLKILLESHGHTVSLTRSTDVFIPLSERAEQANKWGADYFVSLHDNAATANVTGFETFIHNGPVSSKTAGFQNAVHNAIIKSIGIKDRGKKRANFAVLRQSWMPAVLIEYGFISNTNDERVLNNEVEKLAQLTANGIVNYVGGVKPSAPTPTPKKEEIYLKLSATQKAELAGVYKHAREKSVFSSSEHEKDVSNDKMTQDKAIYLIALIAGAALNGGERIK
jgi:N-acetylmuramoyl-L-alanine amidase